MAGGGAGYIGFVPASALDVKHSGAARLAAWARLFAVGSLVHLTLPDIQQPGWQAPAVIELAGALWLLVRPSAFGFVLCGLGTLWPLLALRDVLTQSALLTVFAGIGAAGCALGWRRALDAARLVTAATYALAALHKLNTAFFDPAYSCANHAWAQVVARYGAIEALSPPAGALPFLAIGLELALALAVWRRSRWMWPLGIVFHLPLTVTLAPAFAAVMFIGYAAAVPVRDRVRLRRIARRHGVRIAAAGLLAGALDLALLGGVPDVAAWLKVIAAGALLAWTLPLLGARRSPPPPRADRAGRVVTALWVLHGLTPYVGWQYQHTAAMLSNLRIDAGCHNSLVFPEWLVGVDPYVRIDAASIGDGARPEREETVEATLWNLAALHTMRRNWCVAELRPIRFEGSWRGRPFVIADLCAEGWLDALPGAARWPAGFQRFQKNLLRACPAACVH